MKLYELLSDLVKNIVVGSGKDIESNLNKEIRFHTKGKDVDILSIYVTDNTIHIDIG